MIKIKHILTGIIITTLIGAVVYFSKTYKYYISEPIPYKITSVGTRYEEIKRARYHIVAGAVPREETEIKNLAERVIKDITRNDLDLKEAELFFFQNSEACLLQAAVAYAKWNPEGIFVKIRMGEIDLEHSTPWWKD